MKGLKLISLNIERSKHLELVIPFLQKEQADVVCLQELDEKNVPMFTSVLKAKGSIFSPMLHSKLEESSIVGIGIFSRLPVVHADEHYYVGTRQHLPELDHDLTPIDGTSPANVVLTTLDVQVDGEKYHIATTHFSWSPQGMVTDAQRSHMKALLRVLSTIKEIIFCGDFNAPRGGEIWHELSSRYQDNIPPTYKTSIDVNLHRAGKERPQELADKMVDGLFTTPSYRASDVRLVSGVSDHMAIVANITRI